MNEKNYREFKQNYLAQISREAPAFLAYIEIYDVDFHDLEIDDNLKRGMCSGSLISTQYVLT